MLAIAVLFVPAVAAAESEQAQTFTVLHSFTGNPDGAIPYDNLVRDKAGNLYGTTLNEGSSGRDGVVFKVDTSGTETVLHSFTGLPDGAYPYDNLVRDKAGNLYGTTHDGGDSSCIPPYGCGTVFKVATSGKESVLYSFMGPPDGASPSGGLIGTRRAIFMAPQSRVAEPDAAATAAELCSSWKPAAPKGCCVASMAGTGHRRPWRVCAWTRRATSTASPRRVAVPMKEWCTS
jgi:uncharacterized repeat protein (TIGR03803 family)